MIFVSPEIGSADLVDPLRKAGLVVEKVKLDYADVEFQGRGEHGKATAVGVEIKRLGELTSDWDRFCGAQLPKMLKAYSYRYLLYEGEWKQNAKGTLLRRAGPSTFRPLYGQSNASALRKKLYGLALRGGMLTYPTKDRADTVRHLVDLYRMWTDEDFDKHKSHMTIYQPHGLLEYSDFVRAVGVWHEVGIQRARAAEKVFKTIRRAAMGTVQEWAEIQTLDTKGHPRKIGTKTATQIVTFLEKRP